MRKGTCGFWHCGAPVHFDQAEGEAPGVGYWRHDDRSLDYQHSTGRGHAPISITHSHPGGVDADHGPHVGDDVTHAHELTLPSGEPNPYPTDDGNACSWCEGTQAHKRGCPLRVG